MTTSGEGVVSEKYRKEFWAAYQKIDNFIERLQGAKTEEERDAVLKEWDEWWCKEDADGKSL